jgi:hypothetical protein
MKHSCGLSRHASDSSQTDGVLCADQHFNGPGPPRREAAAAADGAATRVLMETTNSIFVRLKSDRPIRFYQNELKTGARGVSFKYDDVSFQQNGAASFQSQHGESSRCSHNRMFSYCRDHVLSQEQLRTAIYLSNGCTCAHGQAPPCSSLTQPPVRKRHFGAILYSK